MKTSKLILDDTVATSHEGLNHIRLASVPAKMSLRLVNDGCSVFSVISHILPMFHHQGQILNV